MGTAEDVTSYPAEYRVLEEARMQHGQKHVEWRAVVVVVVCVSLDHHYHSVYREMTRSKLFTRTWSKSIASLPDRTIMVRVIELGPAQGVRRPLDMSAMIEPPIQEQMIDVMGKLNEKLNMNANGDGNHRAPSLRLIQHAAARAALDGASAIQPPDEITLALEKYGTAEEKMAGYRMEMASGPSCHVSLFSTR